MSNLLTNPNMGLSSDVGVIGGYNQPQQNIQHVLNDNIINKAKTFIDGRPLLKLNDIILDVLKDYEIIISDEENKKQDYNIINQQYLNMFLKAKQIEGCSPKTIEYYEKEDKEFFSFINKGVLDITTEDIRDYLAFNQKLGTVSNRTLDNKRRVLSTTFQWFCDEGYIMKNPLISIKKIRHKKKVEQPWTADDVEKLRQAFAKPPKNNGYYAKTLRLRNIAIFELLISSGIRANECVQLNRGDINFDDNSVIVYGKGAKQREAYFNSKAKLALENYLNARTDDKLPLFFSKQTRGQGDNRLTVNALERVFRIVSKETGIPAHPHKCRKFFATYLLRKGVPLEQVKTLLGHANIDTTQIYALTDDKEVELNHRNLLG